MVGGKGDRPRESLRAPAKHRHVRHARHARHARHEYSRWSTRGGYPNYAEGSTNATVTASLGAHCAGRKEGARWRMELSTTRQGFRSEARSCTTGQACWRHAVNKQYQYIMP